MEQQGDEANDATMTDVVTSPTTSKGTKRKKVESKPSAEKKKEPAKKRAKKSNDDGDYEDKKKTKKKKEEKGKKKLKEKKTKRSRKAIAEEPNDVDEDDEEDEVPPLPDESVHDRWVTIRTHVWQISRRKPPKEVKGFVKKPAPGVFTSVLSKAPTKKVDSSSDDSDSSEEEEEEEEGTKEAPKGDEGSSESPTEMEKDYKYYEPPEGDLCYFDALPFETITYIFEFLYADSLRSVAGVCAEWNAIARDPHLRDRLVVKLGSNDGSYGVSRNYYVFSKENKFIGMLRDPMGTVPSLHKLHSYQAQLSYLLPLKMKKWGEEPTERVPSSSGKASLWRWASTLAAKDKIEFRLSLNIGRVEHAVHSGQPLPPGEQLMWDLLDESLPNMRLNEAFLKVQSVPSWVSPSLLAAQPKRVVPRLYSYQMETLGWMKTTEDKIIRNDFVQFSVLGEWPEVETSLLFDFTNHWFFPAGTNMVTLRTKGGIVADEMGLGKTLTMLALILANPQRKIHLAYDLGDKTRFRTRATLIFSPSHLCKEWANEVKKQIRPALKVHIVTTMVQLEKLSIWEIMQADVICVSFQLLKNKNYHSVWECGKDCDSGRLRLKVREHMDAMDKVQKEGGDPTTVLKKALSVRLEAFYYHRVIIDEGHEVLSYNNNSVRNEAASPNLVCHQIAKYPSTYRWYVSGTPFPQEKFSVMGALHFLQAKVSNGKPIDVTKANFFSRQIVKTIVDNLYLRHTKENVVHEYDIPPLKEQVVFIDQSPIEKGIYDLAKYQGKGETRLRQLCCHMQISEEDERVLGSSMKSLEQVRKDVLEYIESQIRTNLDTIRREKSEKQNYKVRLAQAIPNSSSWSWIVDRLQRCGDSIRKCEADNVELKKFIAYFEGLAPKKKASILDLPDKEKGKEKEQEKEKEKEKEEADKEDTKRSKEKEQPKQVPTGISFGLTSVTFGPTPRGHIKKPVKPVPKLVRSASWRAPDDLEGLIDLYGSKMGHLVSTLRRLCKEDTKNRVIIFSQWDKMLHRVSDVLNESGISNSFCQGNVYSRNNAIGQFRGEITKRGAKESRVLMLSFKHAASGTNLQDATHIVMIDPVGGTRKEARDIEAQAIGRAHRLGQKKEITLLRFIVKNTVEYELYTRNSEAQK